MYQYNPVVGGLILVNDAKADAALAQAKANIGEAEYKKGYSEESAKIIAGEMKKTGTPVIKKIAGEFNGIAVVTNESGGIKYPKLRVMIGNTLLSLDIGGEYAQRALCKIETLIRDEFEGEVVLSAFTEVVERDGRNYANHVAALKYASDLVEVAVYAGHFGIVAGLVREGTEKIRSAEAKSQERRAIKVDYFTTLAEELAELRPLVKPEPAAAPERTPAQAPVRQAAAPARPAAMPQRRTAPNPQYATPALANFDDMDDDIPF